MANLKISELPEAAAAILESTDPVPFADLSASETKKVTVKNLIQGGIQFIDDASIPGVKIDGALAAGSINTDEIAGRAVTKIKLADNATISLGTEADAAAGAYQGHMWINPADGLPYYWTGAWTPFPAGISSITGGAAGQPIQVVATTTNGATTLSAAIAASTGNRQFLAGPTASAGNVTLRPITGLDLPVATTATRGAVSVDGVDLAVNAGGVITINNAIAATTAFHVVSYNDAGLVQGGRAITAGDLPIATTTDAGVVLPGTDFAVSGTGELSIANTVAAGENCKITYDERGLITGGTNLDSDDIPNLPARLITEGTLPVDSNDLTECLEDGSVGGRHIADYTVTLIQDTNPGSSAGYHLGQRWLNPLTRQECIYARGSAGDYWMPVGLGALVADNIRWLGMIDASTGVISVLTGAGVAEGYRPGTSPGSVTIAKVGGYFIVDTAGDQINEVSVIGTTFDPGDWLLAFAPTVAGDGMTTAGGGWTRIDTLSGPAGWHRWGCNAVSGRPAGC